MCTGHNGRLIPESSEIVETEYKWKKVKYTEYFFLDYDVCEDTGIIDRSKIVKFYTSSQFKRNQENLIEAYNKAIS